MIKLDYVYIEEFRGIRSLELTLGRKSFVVVGPNGSGKSGVVDAIEFGLTGSVSRLSGSGTGGLSIGSHGPHVDHRGDPERAFVRLGVFFPSLDKSATVTRRVSNPKEPTVDPSDPDVIAALAEVAAHPELTLTRREIVRFILTGATQRSKDVQALLRLDSIDQARATLKTTQNRLGNALNAAETHRLAAEGSLREQIGGDDLSLRKVLDAVNPHREILGVGRLSEGEARSALDDGVGAASSGEDGTLHRESLVSDLGALGSAVETLPEAESDDVALLVDYLRRLEEDPEFVRLLSSTDLVATGLDLIADPSCPLCDTEWDIARLREHLERKLTQGGEARETQQSARVAAIRVASTLDDITRKIMNVSSWAETLGGEAASVTLSRWSDELEELSSLLSGSETRSEALPRLRNVGVRVPREVRSVLQDLSDAAQRLPEQGQTANAVAFVSRAQDRYQALESARETEQKAREASDLARLIYKAYCDASETELTDLYKEVESCFAAYYQRINSPDEAGFQARLEPAAGKLDLAVDFYDRGLFPPGAYHSEGHQDGMGVCLYLALMSHLLDNRFSLSVLDDVVMSVDSEHRREFSHLLRQEFPDTQFVVTTHDRVWAAQLRSVGLASSRSTVAFHSWTIDSGPVVEDVKEVWDEIDRHIDNDDVPAAAAHLRRYLEHVTRDLAGNLSARPPFRPDNSYDLGDLLPSAIGAMRDLLGAAAKAAQSWGKEDDRDEAANLKKKLGLAVETCNIEQWAVNRAVHYNEWANFTAPDFRPVVAAFRELLGLFRCDNPDCGSWIYLTPARGTKEALRCYCGAANFNLRSK